VLGSRERLKAIAGAGSLLDAETLQRSRVLTVNEALRKMPGVVARDEEGLGLRPNIGIRGLNPTRSTKVLLLEDGLPLTFAPYGDNASYFHPPIERFERIELLKGASQIAFGPQTIGGVINYITRRAPDDFSGALEFRGGNRGLRDAQLRVGDRLDATGTGWMLNATHKRSDGARDNMDLRIDDLALRLEQPLGESRTLIVRTSLFREDSQVPYSGLTLAEWQADPHANAFVDDYFEIDRWSFAATLGQRFDVPGELRTSVYYTYLDRDWWRQSSNSGQRPNDSSDPACASMANLGTRCGNEGRLRQYYTAGAETRWNQPLALGGLSGEWNAGLRWHVEKQYRVQVNGDTPTARTPGTSVNAGVREDNQRDVAAASGFIEASLGSGRWRLKPGVRYERIDFERRNLLNGTVGETSLEEWIPGVGLTVELGAGHTLYAGVHRGFAPPRVEDIIGASGGSVDLDAEYSWNAELGLRSAPARRRRAGVDRLQHGFLEPDRARQRRGRFWRDADQRRSHRASRHRSVGPLRLARGARHDAQLLRPRCPDLGRGRRVPGRALLQRARVCDRQRHRQPTALRAGAIRDADARRRGCAGPRRRSRAVPHRQLVHGRPQQHRDLGQRPARPHRRLWHRQRHGGA
jgi:Fe(3+) dicitrate transport protein